MHLAQYEYKDKIKEKIDVCKRKGIKESRIKFKKFDATYKIRKILLAEFSSASS